MPFADHQAAAQARHALAIEIKPAALRMLGERIGTAWLVPLWQNVAQRAAPLPFRADEADSHAAPLHLLSGNWLAAHDAVTGIGSWRRIPAPLMWMAEARYRADGLEASWPLLVELAWLSPNRFDSLLNRLTDSSLHALRKTFDAAFEGTGEVVDLAWFPAWILTEKAGLARLFSGAQPSLQGAPERAMRLMLELLSLERQGHHHELLERRRTLQALHGSLYAAYMKTR